MSQAFGIDIGGSGMKAAPVDLASGTLGAERYKILTPQPSTPKAMAQVVRQLVEHFEWESNVGVAFPAVVRNGVARSAANIDHSWIGTDIDAVFTEAAGLPVHVINDADAAGLAEMRYGAGRGRDGVVIMLTFGTGIGSGFFINGQLVPNTELGHLLLDGHKAEHRAAAVIRDREKLSWKEWGQRVDRYLEHLVFLFSPDLFIVGGGVSRKAEKWLPCVNIDVEIVPARAVEGTIRDNVALFNQSADADVEAALRHGPRRVSSTRGSIALSAPAVPGCRQVRRGFLALARYWCATPTSSSSTKRRHGRPRDRAAHRRGDRRADEGTHSS